MTTFASHIAERIHARFLRLYGGQADACLARVLMMVGRYGLDGRHPGEAVQSRWDSRSALLITYADTLRAAQEPGLVTLKRFADTRLASVFDAIHLLPFFPYSSDDGFSVIHYRQVRPEVGQWSHVQALGEQFRLAFDLVLNHTSRQSGWFLDYVTGVAPGRDYFIEADPAEDLSAVVRPRSLPLLTEVQTRNGKCHLWTTFSADQVDLNFRNPDVLFDFLDLLLFYACQGARVIRLDAIAFLWKTPGTSCLHQPETHEIVKLMRDFLIMTAPAVQLLTETNVPHAENVAYFGDGDEAQMVYQFALPPLVLHTMLTGNARALTAWANALVPPPAGCTFLNFTASHDGIGIRPVEGLLAPEELEAMVAAIGARGGQVSTRRDAAGRDCTYELNVTWFDAMGGAADEPDSIHIARFLCSQAIPLALQGIPALYVHSLFGTSGDQATYRATGMPRALNRARLALVDCERQLDDPASVPARIFAGIRHLLESRRELDAFHPDAGQRILDLGEALFVVVRSAEGGGQPLVAVHNITGAAQALPMDAMAAILGPPPWDDALAHAPHAGAPLAPYGVRWLRAGIVR